MENIVPPLQMFALLLFRSCGMVLSRVVQGGFLQVAVRSSVMLIIVHSSSRSSALLIIVVEDNIAEERLHTRAAREVKTNSRPLSTLLPAFRV